TGHAPLIEEAARRLSSLDTAYIDLENRWSEACDRIIELEAPDWSCRLCGFRFGHWDTCPKYVPECGAPALYGRCVLPRGHNIGKLDILENHAWQQWEVCKFTDRWGAIEITRNLDGGFRMFGTWRQAYDYALSGGKEKRHEC